MKTDIIEMILDILAAQCGYWESRVWHEDGFFAPKVLFFEMGDGATDHVRGGTHGGGGGRGGGSECDRFGKDFAVQVWVEHLDVNFVFAKRYCMKWTKKVN